MSSSSAGPAGDGPRFAVVGAYVIDCIARTDRMPEWGESYQGESVHMAPGGKALNMAVALARMGAHVDAIGVVGDDLAGQTVVDALVREGVGIEGLEVRPGARTPICVCFSRTDGETAFLWRIDASVELAADALQQDLMGSANATIVTFECPAAVPNAIAVARSHGSMVVVQPAPPNDAVEVRSLDWNAVDVVVPNELEARTLLAAVDRGHVMPGRDRLAIELSAAFRTDVVVTLGRQGVVIAGSGVDRSRPAPDVLEVVDSTGASDTFTASLTYHLFNGVGLESSVDLALTDAGRSLGHLGGVASGLRPH